MCTRFFFGVYMWEGGKEKFVSKYIGFSVGVGFLVSGFESFLWFIEDTVLEFLR